MVSEHTVWVEMHLSYILASKLICELNGDVGSILGAKWGLRRWIEEPYYLSQTLGWRKLNRQTMHYFFD